MHETVAPLFSDYEVRKNKRQKAAFREYLHRVAVSQGYTCHDERGSLGAVNVVVGDPTTARVTYTAHYDTCVRLPFPNFITPKSLGLYLAYQLAITLAVFAVVFAFLGFLTLLMGILAAFIPVFLETGALVALVGFEGSLIGLLALMLFGPANPHTANDNTSGVATLLTIMATLPPESRSDVAFIFFDLEEAGLLGSSGYYGAHKKAMQNKLLVNFDCVSDGQNLLFCVKKGAHSHAAAIEAAFPSTDRYTVEVLKKGYVYPSDQTAFPSGVGVCATKKTKGGLLYMDRIHTAKDTAFDEENIAYLAAGAVRLVETLREPTP